MFAVMSSECGWPVDVSLRAELGSFDFFSEVVEGSGLEANNGDLVEFNYVCRRSNGYFVYRYKFLGITLPYPFCHIPLH
jgi:hypothetical protein